MSLCDRAACGELEDELFRERTRHEAFQQRIRDVMNRVDGKAAALHGDGYSATAADLDLVSQALAEALS